MHLEQPRLNLLEKQYEFRGAGLAVQTSTDPEVLLSGPAGTGKSLACLYKIHRCCVTYPGIRALFLRKTRVSLTESALVTYEQKVLPAESGINSGAGRANRHSYRYPNGSEIVVGGLDNPQYAGTAAPRARIMSTDWDIIFVQEAIELTEKDWEDITTRLRNNHMPYQQLIADTNPDRPGHWLKKRCNEGRTKMLESRHEDNPLLWDAKTQAWTAFAHRPDGTGYIDRLDRLTGPRKDRLRRGRWVQAEGVVYETWDAERNVIDEMPKGWQAWPRYMTIDFGYNNPFVAQWWARSPDDNLYLYREWYKTKMLVEDHAAKIKWLWMSDPRPQKIICDHDAEDRATLEKHLALPTIAAEKTVTPGLQAVAARMKPGANGKPRLFILRSALVERDPLLVDLNKPTSTLEEIDGYVWKDNAKKDEPVKENDHGCDGMRYMVSEFDLKNNLELRVWT